MKRGRRRVGLRPVSTIRCGGCVKFVQNKSWQDARGSLETEKSEGLKAALEFWTTYALLGTLLSDRESDVEVDTTNVEGKVRWCRGAKRGASERYARWGRGTDAIHTAPEKPSKCSIHQA